MKIWTKLVAALVAIFAGVTTASAAGNLAADATRLPDLTINSVDLTFSQNEYELETGKYYRLRIVHDGAEEMAIVAPELFRNSWINQVVINDLEVTPYGLYSVEFDDEGTIDIWLVPIRPGEYDFWADGFEERGMIGKFVVK